MKSTFIFGCFLLLSVTSFAQDRYLVFFKDKKNSTFSISSPSQFLSAKSVARRARLSISLTEEDLPVNNAYVQQVKSTGAKTYFTTKWWNGVLIETTNSVLPLITNLPFVERIELVAPDTKLQGSRIGAIESNANSTSQTTDFQLSQVGIDRMQLEDYFGEGVDVAQFDSGWKGVNTTSPFAHLFADGRVKDRWNFVRNSFDVYADDSHGTDVLSTMAAKIPATFSGGIPNANFYLYETEDRLEEYRIEEYNWAFAAERADSIGVDVINSSLGYNEFDNPSMNYTKASLDGKTTIISQTAKKAIDKGIVVVTSAGNEGNKSWKNITAPADVDGIIAVGAVTIDGLRSSFSSFGPTADGRIKPDVVALGSATSVVNQSGTIGTNSGTSLSSPLIACLAAGLIQAFPNARPKEIYNAIIASANQYQKSDNSLGYGIPSFTRAKSYLSYGYLQSEISIYPNPVINSLLTVLIKEPTDKPITISISDFFGTKLLNYKSESSWETNPVRIDLTPIPNGLYIVEIVSGSMIATKKICKVN
jgi:serine protease AprX